MQDRVLPGSCGPLCVEADYAQWTSTSLGPVLDQFEVQANFSTTDPPITAEAESQSGQLDLGKNALTMIAVAPGTHPRSASTATTASRGSRRACCG